LTRDTIDYLQRRHSPDDRGQSTESYAKDQVDGPLGAASHETRERVDGPLGQAQTEKTVEKDVHETTHTYKTKSVPTDSEETVSGLVDALHIFDSVLSRSKPTEEKYEKYENIRLMYHSLLLLSYCITSHAYVECR